MRKKVVLSVAVGVALFAASTMANTLQIGGDSAARDIGWKDAGMTGTNQTLVASYMKDGVTFNVTATTGAGNTIPGANAGLAVIGDGTHDGRIDGTEWIEFSVSVDDPAEKLTALSVNGFAINFLGQPDRVLDVSDGTSTVTISNIVDKAVVAYTNELAGLEVLSFSNTNTWTARFTSGSALSTNGAIGGIILDYEVVPEPEDKNSYFSVGGHLDIRQNKYTDLGFASGQISTGSYTTPEGITFNMKVETAPGWTMTIKNGTIEVIGDGSNDSRIDGTEWVEWSIESIDDPEGLLKDITCRGITVHFLTATGEIMDVSDGTTTIPVGVVDQLHEVQYKNELVTLDNLTLATTNSWKLRTTSANAITSFQFGQIVFGYTLKTPIYKIQFGGNQVTRLVDWNDHISTNRDTNVGSASYTTNDITFSVGVETDPAWALVPQSGRLYVDSGVGDSNTNRLSDSEWLEFSVSVLDPSNKLSTFEVESISFDFLNKDGEAVEASDGSATTNLVAIPSGDKVTYEDYLSGLQPLTNDNTSTWSIRFTSIDVGGLNPTEGSVAGITIAFTEKSPYVQWAESYGLTGSDAEKSADVEPDGVINLLEYAQGGNPTVDDAASVSPELVTGTEGGTNWLNYVYTRRIDAYDRGLEYNVFSSTDLVLDVLTNATEEAGSALIDTEFESVTNRVSTDVLNKQFMQLEVIIDDE
jgi:hypothetical protein